MQEHNTAITSVIATPELQKLAKDYLELKPLTAIGMQMRRESILAELKHKTSREELPIEAIETLARGQNLPREHGKASQPPTDTRHLPRVC